MPNSAELAWLVGFFEGEGYAGRVDHSPTLTPQVTIVNTDESLINRCFKLIGYGKIQTYTPTQPNRKVSFIWRASKDEAIAFAMMIAPRVVSQYKKGQLIEVLGNDIIRGDFTEPLQWVTGLFEAEGSAGQTFNKNNNSISMAMLDGRLVAGQWTRFVTVSNCQNDMLEEVQRTLGFGSIYMKIRDRPNTLPQFQYQLASDDAIRFANTLLPQVFSERKRQQLLDCKNELRYIDALESGVFNHWIRTIDVRCSVCGEYLSELNWYESLRRKRDYICIRCKKIKVRANELKRSSI